MLFPDSSVGKESACNAGDPGSIPRSRSNCQKQTWNNGLVPNWERVCQGLSDSSVSKESACKAGDPGSIPGSGISTGEGIGYPLQYSWASLVAQLVKNLPAMWETQVQSLGWEDPLKKGKATTPVFWPREFHGLYSPWGRKELDTTERFSLPFTLDSNMKVGSENLC